MHALCRRLRWVLVGALILALPFKGFAAAGHLGCVALGLESPPQAMAHDVMDVATQIQAEAPCPSHEPSQKQQPAHEAKDSTPPKPSIKCAQCAPCCGAVAVQSELFWEGAPLGPGALKTVVLTLALGDALGGLERPPRPAWV